MQRPARFQRAVIFPESWDDTVSEFLQLFHHHRYQYIYRPHDSDSWLSANEDWRLTDTEILKAVAGVHPKYLLGFRFGKQTRFAVLDIDAESPYHNLRSFNKLKRVLRDAGITQVVPFRSSTSSGWHLYIFFDELVNSLHLKRALVNLLTYTGFRIKSGELEIFPNVSHASAGMGLRLPLQSGFAFLNDRNLESDIERWELSPTKALDYFLDAANSCSNTRAQFEELQKHATLCAEKLDKVTALRAQPRTPGNVIAMPDRKVKIAGQHTEDVAAIFSVMPPGIRADDWFRGRTYHATGLSGPSQRADAIHCLSHYLFYGDPSCALPALGYGYETERELAIKQILELRHNGFSKDLNKGEADAVSQIERAANWIPPHRRQDEPKKYAPVQPISWVRENANRKVDARKRIQSALEKLKSASVKFTTVDLQKSAQCSRETLYKHEDIWRQAYEDLADGFFAICTDEYNGVEGGGSSETAPLTPSDKKDVPAGLLAARRIVFELKMRDQKEKRKRDLLLADMSKTCDRYWLSELARLQELQVSTSTFKDLRTLLVSLRALKATAPDEDAQVTVEALMNVVAHRIATLISSKDNQFRPDS
ncbi:MAG: hypothetical protein DKT66_28340 [Candidatus Melainabacteria bacterium]|nr:MAG: hypothetical protein DKT66_28340 [Candidatus Melainabacteria bacterium]